MSVGMLIFGLRCWHLSDNICLNAICCFLLYPRLIFLSGWSLSPIRNSMLIRFVCEINRNFAASFSGKSWME